jgi:hypothetical protein
MILSLLLPPPSCPNLQNLVLDRSIRSIRSIRSMRALRAMPLDSRFSPRISLLALSFPFSSPSSCSCSSLSPSSSPISSSRNPPPPRSRGARALSLHSCRASRIHGRAVGSAKEGTRGGVCELSQDGPIVVCDDLGILLQVLLCLYVSQLQGN